jgi:hypothetical protein
MGRGGSSPKQDWVAGDSQFLGKFWDSILQEGGAITLEEQMYGVPSDVTMTPDQIITQGQEAFPIPQSYKDDFYHFDTGAEERENPYSKTFGDRFRNTTKWFQNPRRNRQTNIYQDGGANQAMFDYMQAQGFAGDTIQVGDKSIDLTQDKYKQYHYPGTFKGKKQDRPFMDGRPIPTDSIANVPGVDPEQMRVHWSKSGKPTPVGSQAKQFIEEYGNYYAKGKSNPEVFPSFKKPTETIVTAPSPYVQQEGGRIKSVETTPDFRKLSPEQREGYNTSLGKFVSTPKGSPQQNAYRKLIERLHGSADYDIKAGADSVNTYYNPPITQGEEIPGYQDGGPITEDQYKTAEDARREKMHFVTPDEWNAEFGNKKQREEAKFNMITDPQLDESTYTTNPPLVMTYGEWVMDHGSPEEKTAWLDQVASDAAVIGKDPAEYIAEELSGIEMTAQETEDLAEDLKGLHPGINFRSLKKELAKEKARANRNSHPMKLVDPNTGKIVNENPNPAQIKAFNAAAQKTTGKNVKTSGKRVWDVPEDATIHEYNDQYKPRGTKVGDYVKYPDGSYKKISENTPVRKGTSASGPENYKPTYESIEEDVKKAKEILERNVNNGAFELGTTGKNKGKWITNRHAKDVLTIAEKDLLTQVSQYRGTKGDLGALDLHFGTQKSGGDNFYGFADGEMLEYKYWKANNPGGTADQFEQLDPEDMVANRKSFLSVVTGYTADEINKLEADGRLVTPGDLYTKDFMTSTKDKQGFTSRLEKGFGEDSGFRKALGDDSKIGMDHLDNFQIDIEQKFTDVGMKDVKDPSVVEKSDDPQYDSTSIDAPWWAQDVGNMLMTVGERASIKKYLPHSFPIDLARPDAVYYDPSRALAANAEQANIAAQAASAFAGPQSTYQLTGIQGQAFQQAANTLADYEAKNVGIANQYLDKVKATADRSNIMNAERMTRLYDQTTVANQQYDNAKRAANRNVFDAWRQGLTNATKTQTMNMLYPQYNVDPRSGGITHFTEGRDQTIDPSSSKGYAKGYKDFIKATGLPNEGKSYEQYARQQGLTPRNRRRNPRPGRDQFMHDYSGGYNPYG